jgi:hypothetical protein
VTDIQQEIEHLREVLMRLKPIERTTIIEVQNKLVELIKIRDTTSEVRDE